MARGENRTGGKKFIAPRAESASDCRKIWKIIAARRGARDSSCHRREKGTLAKRSTDATSAYSASDVVVRQARAATEVRE